MTDTWGPQTWALFHTMIEHLDESDFAVTGPKMFGYIRRICNLLPCPECQQHAKTYLNNQRIDLMSKAAVREFIHKFHNAVNRYKKRTEPSIDILDQYRKKNLATVYNTFAVAFGVRGNVRLLADTMQRTLLMREFKKWLLENRAAFAPRSTTTTPLLP